MLYLFDKYKLLFIIIFVFIASKSVYQSVVLSIHGSVDMQWYPATQYWGLGNFIHSINPYLASLSGDTFMAQDPNYAPMLYVLMYPFALMDFENAKIFFAIFSVICFFGTMFLFYKKINLAFLLLVSIFVLFGYTFGNVIANGQVAIILGFFLALGYMYRKNWLILTICLSILFTKYSFGIPILIGFFLAGYIKEVIFAGIINLVFVILFALQFDITIWESLILPLKVSSQATGVGPSDLMSLSRSLFDGSFFSFSNPFLWVITLIYCAYIWICLRIPPPPARIIASSILLSLGTFYHLGYDQYMFFIAILFAKFCLKSTYYSMCFLVILALFFWIGSRIQNFLPDGYHWAMNMGSIFCFVGSVMILISSFWLLFLDRNKKELMK
ncbi:hypothetical protein [Helicobacter sp. 13S00482-2]|uniref:hypothetical protein n=1 Tax=Helicobacter sp. 13S00482-2 TaxID=1476200 RepID=UPI00117B1D3E|nr:hypothetical protein [Helicobacter sp. 13S00482-2]